MRIAAGLPTVVLLDQGPRRFKAGFPALAALLAGFEHVRVRRAAIREIDVKTRPGSAEAGAVAGVTPDVSADARSARR